MSALGSTPKYERRSLVWSEKAPRSNHKSKRPCGAWRKTSAIPVWKHITWTGNWPGCTRVPPV